MQEKAVQHRIWEKFAVHADQVLQGKGKTNTGGIAKKCFNEPEKFANALGIDKDIVVRLSKILSAFSAREQIDYDKLEQYCLETNKLFYETFPWAQMRPSVHKLLVHGCQIARTFRYSQLYYAEDAIEHWHQLHRKHSITHSRQTSRSLKLKDMASYSIYSTDPVISLFNINHRIQSYKQQFRQQDISQFFINPPMETDNEPEPDNHNESDDSSSDSDEADNEPQPDDHYEADDSSSELDEDDQ